MTRGYACRPSLPGQRILNTSVKPAFQINHGHVTVDCLQQAFVSTPLLDAAVRMQVTRTVVLRTKCFTMTEVGGTVARFMCFISVTIIIVILEDWQWNKLYTVLSTSRGTQAKSIRWTNQLNFFREIFGIYIVNISFFFIQCPTCPWRTSWSSLLGMAEV